MTLINQTKEYKLLLVFLEVFNQQTYMLQDLYASKSQGNTGRKFKNIYASANNKEAIKSPLDEKKNKFQLIQKT